MGIKTTDTAPAHRLALAIEARIKRSLGFARRHIAYRKLERQNLESTKPIVAPGGPIVSVTTFGKRLTTAHYALECIAAGEQLPSRLVLWIEHDLLANGLPDTLKRLIARGLEVRGTEDLGPHKKYFPQVISDPSPSMPLVTADDDQLYPRHWLRTLVESADELPELIHCFRAHRIGFKPDGQLVPYRRWAHCMTRRPSHLNFATGCGGVIYPIRMQSVLARLGTAFSDCCPRADDVWLKAVALRERIMVRQVVPAPARNYDLRETRGQSGLALYNNSGGGNDIQLAATFTQEDLALLRECAVREATA